jgi:hypothetical protein
MAEQILAGKRLSKLGDFTPDEDHFVESLQLKPSLQKEGFARASGPIRST